MHSDLRHLILLILQLSLRKVVSLGRIVNPVSVLLKGAHHVHNAILCLVSDELSWSLLLEYDSRTRHKLLYTLPLNVLYTSIHQIIVIIVFILFFLFEVKIYLIMMIPSADPLMPIYSKQTARAIIVLWWIDVVIVIIIQASSRRFYHRALLILMIEMIHHVVLAIRARVSSSKPFPYARWVKTVKAREYHKLILKLIVAHTDCARFVFFSKIFSVDFSECWFR